MRKSVKETRLEQLEKEFQPLLIRCLKECAEERRGGLFDQMEGTEAERYLKWHEAKELRAMALEIRSIRSEWGSTNPAVEEFLTLCAERGANLMGEPKRAAKFLAHLLS